MHRRKINRITALRNTNGDWLEKPGKLGEIPSSRFLSLEDSDINFLQKEVTDEEIKATLFDMAPLKALGSDGYHVFFFQNQWDNIGGAVYAWVKEVFNGRHINPELNNTNRSYHKDWPTRRNIPIQTNKPL
ncbi:tyrosine decarboxylase 1-like [Gossypium australe]|uniref:Tyrosine decarboxylase 1-like n=1 Tax=Gossypium australe TaxID=47621 RepID=A0A5B6V0X3_9ROSI|nr:tyrosine decarboxylase 1-like [Gossypium australe]